MTLLWAMGDELRGSQKVVVGRCWEEDAGVERSSCVTIHAEKLGRAKYLKCAMTSSQNNVGSRGGAAVMRRRLELDTGHQSFANDAGTKLEVNLAHIDDIGC